MESPEVVRGHSRRRRLAAVVVSSAAVVSSALVAFTPGVAGASSHREAPLIAGDPQHDNTDVYAFTSPEKRSTVTLVANWIPFEEPNGGPNFYPFKAGSYYDINVDNNGDAVADHVYRWVFTDIDTRADTAAPGDQGTFLYNTGPVTSFNDPDLRFKQTYTLTDAVTGQVLVANAPVAPSNTGVASFPDYQALRTEATVPTKLFGQSFAGQADDPFFLDLRVFDLLYGGDLSETGQDTLAGYNVNSVALQLPKTALALNNNPDGTDANGDGKADTGNPVIGVWSTTSRQSLNVTTGLAQGPYAQVSRLGNPLVNEVVLPANLKDTFNAITPASDFSIAPVTDRVLNPELPALIKAIYGIPAPKTPRTDLAEIFFSGVTTQLDGFGAMGSNYVAPIALDLNSQAMNADVTTAAFRPSEMLRLNMSTPVTSAPSRLGVIGGDLQGFPNGRRLIDDVVDIEVQVLEGFFTGSPADMNGDGFIDALAGGDAVDANDNAFGKTFPYLALPNTAAVNQANS